MSVATETIKIIGQTGEIYISPNQTVEYKGFTLFGYNYSDWGTKINQAIVTLIDQIDALQDGNLSEIQFDLETYTEEQKVLRTQEFTIWKAEFKKILQDIVDTSDVEITELIDQVKESVVDLGKKLNETINANDLAINEKIEQVENAITTSFNDKLNTELGKVLEMFQEANDSVSNAQLLLKDSKIALETAMSSIKNQLETFKTDFTTSFETFKNDTNKTLIQYKENIIAYIDEKFGTATNKIDTERERIDRIEMLLEAVTPDILSNLIKTGIDSSAKLIIETYMTNLVSKVSNLETANSNLDSHIQSKVEEYTDDQFQQLEDNDESLNLKFTSLKNKVDSHDTKIGEVETFVNNYETIELSLFGKNDNVALYEINEHVKDIEFLNISNLFKNYTQEVAIQKIKENIALQNLENNKNILTYLDSKFNLLMNQLSKTNADEIYLASKISSTLRTNLVNNVNKNIKDINYVKGIDTSKILDIQINFTTKKVYFLFNLVDGLTPSIGTLTNVRTNLNKTGITWKVLDKIQGFGQKFEGEYVYYKDNCLSSWLVVDISSTGLLKTDNLKIDIETLDSTGNPGPTLTKTILGSDYESGQITELKLDSLRDYIYVNNPTALTALNSPSISEVVQTSLISGISIPKKEIIENDGVYYLLLRIKLQESYVLNNIELVYNNNTISYSVDNIANVPNNTTSLETLRNNWQFNYFKDIDSTGLLTIPLTGTIKTTKAGATVIINGDVSDIQANIKYNNGSIDITKSLTIKSSLGGGSGTKFVTATIANNAYHEIDTNVLFGSNMGKTTLVDVKIKDKTTGSETLGMYLNAETVSVVAIKDERYIRVYNKSLLTSEFYIAVTPRNLGQIIVAGNPTQTLSHEFTYVGASTVQDIEWYNSNYYVATDKGLIYSSDYSVWDMVPLSNGLYIIGLYVYENYMVATLLGGEILISKDNGTTWTLKTFSMGHLYASYIENISGTDYLYLGSQSGELLKYNLTTSTIVYQLNTVNSGYINSIIRYNGIIVITGFNCLAYITDTNTVIKTDLAVLNGSVTYKMYQDLCITSSGLYCISANNIYKSIDGKTWSVVTTDTKLHNKSKTCMLYNPSRDEFIISYENDVYFAITKDFINVNYVENYSNALNNNSVVDLVWEETYQRYIILSRLFKILNYVV